jgi:hypothetical protein
MPDNLRGNEWLYRRAEACADYVHITASRWVEPKVSCAITSIEEFEANVPAWRVRVDCDRPDAPPLHAIVALREGTFAGRGRGEAFISDLWKRAANHSLCLRSITVSLSM